MRRRLTGVLAVIPLVLTLALMTGCGGGDSGDDAGVASVDGESSGDGGDGGEGDEGGGPGNTEEAMLEFAQCMRDNGVDMSDPGAGEGVFLAPDANDEEMNAAMEACQELMPGGGPPDVTKEMQEAAVEHAECIRENGVEGFPDPNPNGGGSMLDEEISDDPDWDAAEEECAALLPQGGSMREEGGE